MGRIGNHTFGRSNGRGRLGILSGHSGGDRGISGNASLGPASSPALVRFVDARFHFLALLLFFMMFDAHFVAVIGWQRVPTAFSKVNTRRRLLVWTWGEYGQDSKCTNKLCHPVTCRLSIPLCSALNLVVQLAPTLALYVARVKKPPALPIRASSRPPTSKIPRSQPTQRF